MPPQQCAERLLDASGCAFGDAHVNDTLFGQYIDEHIRFSRPPSVLCKRPVLLDKGGAPPERLTATNSFERFALLRSFRH